MTPFVIVTGDFVTTGGMDQANCALADSLARFGRPVSLVAHRAAPALAARTNVQFHPVPKPFGSYLLGSWPLAWTGTRVARRLPGARLIANGGNCRFADVNWVHYVHAAYRPELVVGLSRRLRSAAEYPLNLSTERAALRVARTVVCNSDRTRRDVINLAGVRPERTTTVYYGSDPERFRPAAPDERAALRQLLGWPLDRPVVMFIGALSDRRKGFDTLFSTWAELSRSPDWDALLVVVGQGSELPAWQERCRTSRIAGCVQFLGFRHDVPDLLRAADLLVSPTRYEAYGLGVHEALCCGLPALVSANAGVAERYPQELGDWLLPDPNDTADFATRLRRCRADLALARERVRPFSERLRAYSWDDMARCFLHATGEAV